MRYAFYLPMCGILLSAGQPLLADEAGSQSPPIQAGTESAPAPSPFSLESAVNAVLSFVREHGLAVLVIVAGTLAAYYLFKLVCRRAAFMMTRAGEAATEGERAARARVLAGYLLPIGRILIGFGGLILLLGEFDVPVTALWAVLSTVLAMVAIGFVAVWSVLSNAFCSVILLMFQPFRVGQRIEMPASGVGGKVVNFNMLFTTLQAEDGDLVQLPNNTFFQQPVRCRRGEKGVSLDEQLFKSEEAEG